MRKYLNPQFGLRSIIIGLIFSLSVVGCGSDGKSESKSFKTDLEKENLKGEVVFVDNGWQHLEFNDNGMIIKEIYFSSDYPNSIQELVYIYEANKIIKCIDTRNPMDEGLQEFVNSYSYNENLLSKIDHESNGNYIDEYYYNSSNLLIEYRMTMKYDQTVAIYSTKYYYTENKLDSSYFETTYPVDKFFTKTKSYYDKNGNKMKFISITKDGISTGYIEYKDNFEINRKIISKDGTEEYKTSYVFDKNGNWIKKITTSNSGEEQVEERKLFYKGDYYSNLLDEINIHKQKIKSQTTNSSNSGVIGGGGSNNNNETNNYQQQNNQQQNNQQQNNQQQNTQSEKRKCGPCRGTGQCQKCTVPQNVRYKQGEYPNDHKEIRIGMRVCNQCGGNTMNFGADKNKGCYVCKATGWVYCLDCNVYGNGRNIGKCRTCNGTGVH